MTPGSERNLISICLKNPNKIIDVENHEVFPEHFAVPAHKYIYMSILYLFSKKQKPTPLAILEVLQDNKAKEAIQDIGGIEYLTALEESNVYEDNLSIYCKKVKQSYTRKLIYEICAETQQEMLSEKAQVLNPQELISSLEAKIIDLSVNNSASNEVYKMGDDTEKILRERAESPDVVPGIETGWTKFDRYTNGGQPGDLIFVCARSKTGKSVTLTNWAIKFSIIDKMPILYIDTEMNSREQEDRILANLSGVPHTEIVSGMYVIDTENGKAEEKIAKLEDARKMLKEGNYYHVYMPQFSIERIASLTRKFKIQYGIVALMFDYLKVPANQTGTLKNMQEWQALGFLASGLKDIAGMLNIPVYSAVQENRSDPKNTQKDETNVGGSDRILQLATKLCFLYNKSDEMIAKDNIINGNQQIYIAFQRNGISDAPPINIMFEKHILKQTEV